MSLPSVSGSNVENVSPQVVRRVTKEVMELAESPPEGIKVFINEEDITDIQATIIGPAGTPYEGGVFRMKLVLSRDFPASPPQGFFLTKIFHPNVAKNGAICVNTLKRDWKPDHGIKHILLTIKCLLIYPNPESALNEEAGKLLQERYDDYSSHARMMTEIHAKPPRSLASSSAGFPSSSSSSSSSSTNTTASSRTVSGESCPSGSSSSASSEAAGNGATTGKKRPLSDKSTASSVNGAEKKKKDKKKALKRL